MSQKKEALEALQTLIEEDGRLGLSEFRKENRYHMVFGYGNINADIVFIGEAPGKNEAESGEPFCGASGRRLDYLLDQNNLSRKDVYITNVVKDRPPENRDPTKDEVIQYGQYLLRQLSLIQPRVVAPLGRFAADFIMEHYGLKENIRSISEMHGEVFVGIDPIQGKKVVVIPLYHPAASIYNHNLLNTLLEDMKIVREQKVCKTQMNFSGK